MYSTIGHFREDKGLSVFTVKIATKYTEVPLVLGPKNDVEDGGSMIKEGWITGKMK